MKLIFVLTLISLTTAQIGVAGFFYFEKDFVIYNVKSLTKQKVKTLPSIELKVDDKPIKGIVYYNIFNKLETKQCGTDLASNAFLITEDKEPKCYNLISANRNNNVYTLLEVDPKKPAKTEGFSINSKISSFAVQLKCNKDLIDPTFNFDKSTLTIEAADACGTEDVIGRFISTNKYAFSTLIIIFGLILLFFGGNKWDLILGVSGFMLGVSFVVFIFFVIVDFKNTTISFAVITVLALVVGGLLSYLSYNSTTISYVIIGFPSGYFLTKVLLIAFKITIPDVL